MPLHKWVLGINRGRHGIVGKNLQIKLLDKPLKIWYNIYRKLRGNKNEYTDHFRQRHFFGKNLQIKLLDKPLKIWYNIYRKLRGNKMKTRITFTETTFWEAIIDGEATPEEIENLVDSGDIWDYAKCYSSEISCVENEKFKEDKGE